MGKSSDRRKGKTVTARKCFGTSGHKQRGRERESYLHDEGDTSGLNGAGDFPRCGGRDVLQLSSAVWRGYASPGVSIRLYGVVFGGAEHVKLSPLKPINIIITIISVVLRLEQPFLSFSFLYFLFFLPSVLNFHDSERSLLSCPRC